MIAYKALLSCDYASCNETLETIIFAENINSSVLFEAKLAAKKTNPDWYIGISEGSHNNIKWTTICYCPEHNPDRNHD